MPHSTADDGALTDAWIDGSLGRAISHEEHTRIAFTLLNRHSRIVAIAQIYETTIRNCEALCAADRYGPELTLVWAEALAKAFALGEHGTAATFIGRHPSSWTAGSVSLREAAWGQTPGRRDV